MSDAVVFATPGAETVYRLRWLELGLSQAAFASRFGIPYATVQNIEQGRWQPKPLARLVLAAIALDPDLMARAAIVATAPQTSKEEHDQ
jgi:DNA-binding transcriptional regulator YiaG